LRLKKVIVISGTPGTGKTVLGKALVKEGKKGEHLELGEMIKEEGLYLGYDQERDTLILDGEKFQERIRELIENNEEKEGFLVIDGHIADLIPKDLVDLVVVLKCNPKVLRERLKEKDYFEEKIEENVEAEIMEVCLNDALEAFGEEKIMVLDTSVTSGEELAIRVIEKLLEG
jgi:adenylate kinase